MLSGRVVIVVNPQFCTQETGNIVAAQAALVEVGFPGLVANIATANVLLVGDYASELSSASYTLNNFLTATQTVYTDGTGNHIYYFTVTVWYVLVKAEANGGLVPSAEVDPSLINGDGMFKYMNMVDVLAP